MAVASGSLWTASPGTARRQPEKGVLSRLALDTGKVVAEMPTVGQPMAITSERGRIWVAGMGLSRTQVLGADELVEIKANTLHQVVSVRVLSPLGLAAVGSDIYALSGGVSGATATVGRASTKGFEPLAKLPAATAVTGNPLIACGRYLYAGVQSTSASDGVDALNSVSGAIVGHWSLPQGGDLYLACHGGAVAAAIASANGGIYELKATASVVRVGRSATPPTGLTFTAGRWWTVSVSSPGIAVARSYGTRGLATVTQVPMGSGYGPAVLVGSGGSLWIGLGDRIAEVEIRPS